MIIGLSLSFQVTEREREEKIEVEKKEEEMYWVSSSFCEFVCVCVFYLIFES